MFQDLDTTLTNLLGDASAPAAVLAAEVSFITPDKTYAPQQAETALNLFLHEVKENRTLRENVPIVEQVTGLSVRRKPPLRVDCTYMVTAWSKKSGANKISAEHQLLGQALNWLSRFPTIPERYIQAAGLANQVFDPPTLVAQLDAVKNVGEFWTALGIAPRPFFDLVVTISMELDQSLVDGIVKTIATTYETISSGQREELMIIGGTVRNANGNSVRNAWVRLDPLGLTQIADDSGRFIFSNVARGAGYSLSALAPGYSLPANLNNFEIPSLSGDYDLQFP